MKSYDKIMAESRKLNAEGMIQGILFQDTLESFVVQIGEEDYYTARISLRVEKFKEGRYQDIFVGWDLAKRNDAIFKLLTNKKSRYYKYEERGSLFYLYFKFEMILWRVAFKVFNKMTGEELVEMLL